MVLEASRTLNNHMEIFRNSKSTFSRPKWLNWMEGTHTHTKTDRQTDMEPIEAIRNSKKAFVSQIYLI